MDRPSLLNRLGALALALHDRQARAVALGAGLSPSRAAALVSVGAAPGLGVGELAAIVGVTQPVATRLLADLERDGLLRREREGRAVRLALTPEGAALRDRVLALRAEEAGTALALAERDAPAGAAPLLALVDALLAALTSDAAAGDRICRLCDEAACGLGECPVERACRR